MHNVPQVNALFLSLKVEENEEEGRLKRTERIEWKKEVGSERKKQEGEPEEGAAVSCALPHKPAHKAQPIGAE